MVNNSEYDPDLLDFFLSMLEEPGQRIILEKILRKKDNNTVLEELIEELETEEND